MTLPTGGAGGEGGWLLELRYNTPEPLKNCCNTLWSFHRVVTGFMKLSKFPNSQSVWMGLSRRDSGSSCICRIFTEYQQIIRTDYFVDNIYSNIMFDECQRDSISIVLCV